MTDQPLTAQECNAIASGFLAQIGKLMKARSFDVKQQAYVNIIGMMIGGYIGFAKQIGGEFEQSVIQGLQSHLDKASGDGQVEE